MGKKHEHGPFEKARDRLFAEIQRCGVLEAAEEHRQEWLDDTIQFLGEEFPALTKLELHNLELVGKNYVAPIIPHGKETTDLNRDEWEEEQ